jgi:hypothetical protein
MKNYRSMFPLALVLCLAACGPDDATIEQVMAPAEPAATVNKGEPSKANGFADNFETDKGWALFEEIVGGNTACYRDGLAERVRSAAYARDGRTSLAVTANRGRSNYNNHANAHYKVGGGQTGVVVYALSALIDTATARTGLTGPEFSMQNTRDMAGAGFRTNIAGVQFRPSPWEPVPNSWAIWTRQPDGRADWTVFAQERLEPGRWYDFALTADFSTNRYVSLSIRGDKIDRLIDLSAYAIVPEVRFTESAFHLTLEAENLWSNCGAAGPFEYRVYYDKVQMHPR